MYTKITNNERVFCKTIHNKILQYGCEDFMKKMDPHPWKRLENPIDSIVKSMKHHSIQEKDMEKVTLGSKTLIAPMPAVIVGAMGNNNAINFTTIAWAGIVNSTPPMLGVGIRQSRYIHKLISESSIFSVNVPSKDMAVEADFCGLVSGKDVDKAAQCGFTVYYGELDNAPLIEECPLNIECSVEKIIKLPSHDYIIGKIIQVHIDKDKAPVRGEVNAPIDALVFMGTHYAYTTGNLGKPFFIGKKLLDE
jgi:flavin reductase (DIM6/NTAB) family NADH-FMN oxidoreductase RutF